MGWILSLFFIVYYFISREPVSLLAAALFSISGELGFINGTLEKIHKLYEKRSVNPISGLFETYLKHSEQNKERA